MITTDRFHRQRPVALLCVFGLAVSLIMTTMAPAAAQSYDDATILALELDGPNGVIIPDPELVVAIDAELSLIRAQITQLAAIHVFPDWIPGELMVRMTSEAIAAFRDGTFTGFDELFTLYPVADLHFYTIIPWVTITFEDPLHPVNLAPLFLAVDGVTNVDINETYGDGDDITVEALGSYVFKHGWGDCQSGCLYNHYWQVEVIDGTATVVAEWGDGAPVSVVPSDLAPGLALEAVVPNPFNPSTTVWMDIPRAGNVTLAAHDLRGRLVRTLWSGQMDAGRHRVAWDGTDDGGRRTASGIYLIRLATSDGEQRTMKVTLSK